MEAKLPGVHKVNGKLADGSSVTYYYAWRGGPRITSKPGTAAFTHEFVRLCRGRPQKSQKQTLGELITQFNKSPDFQKLRASTKRDYERSMGIIRARFDSFPVLAIEARGSRKLFLDWRDSMRDSPRAADLHLTVLARIFSWAKDKEIIIRNPLERVSKLHDGGNRKDLIWMPSQLKKVLQEGAPHIVDVVNMALWTMQRQGDVLTMPTIAYDDGRLWITQGKTGTRVRIRPADEILPILEDAKQKNQLRVLVNSYGQSWTSSGFRASFRKEMSRLKITGVRFHDLRGTGISFAYASGMDVERIAEISGHSKNECESIIRRHYLAGADVIEAIRAGTRDK